MASYNFFGTRVPNFAISNDRVLDHLRIRQPNTFKVPPVPRTLIDPNVEKEEKLTGDNNPATNATLRRNVAQAGALVYAAAPILNSNAPHPPTDGCFDGRNHLYFSDGDQWIPLANCLPSSSPSLQYGEFSINDNTAATDTNIKNVWVGVTANTNTIREGLLSAEFKTIGDEKPALEYTGEKERLVNITASMTWAASATPIDFDRRITDARATISVGASPTGGPEGNLITTEQKGSLRYEDSDMPVNVTCSGLALLKKGDQINVKVNKVEAEVNATGILVSFLNLSATSW